MRHTAGAIAIAIAALFIIPVLEQALPSQWRWDIMRFLPDAANQVVSVTIRDNANQHLWSAWPQLGVTALWAAALVGRGRLPVPQARRVSVRDHDGARCHETGAGLRRSRSRSRDRGPLPGKPESCQPRADPGDRHP